LFGSPYKQSVYLQYKATTVSDYMHSDFDYVWTNITRHFGVYAQSVQEANVTHLCRMVFTVFRYLAAVYCI
jgi:hypothetical protein